MYLNWKSTFSDYFRIAGYVPNTFIIHRNSRNNGGKVDRLKIEDTLTELQSIDKLWRMILYRFKSHR